MVKLVLDCERSEPGFESRRPESEFTPTHRKTEEKSAEPRHRHLQPLMTITTDEAQQLQLSHARPIYITHGHLSIYKFVAHISFR